MKIRSSASILILVIVSFAVGAQTASAADIPILTWEQGKLQSVVLGGGTDRPSWDVELVSSTGTTTKLKSSTRNGENFVVFSVVIPRDYPIGSYILFARGLADESAKVAIVNVVEAKSYELGRVPGDLIYVFMFFTGCLSIFVALIRRKFSFTFLTSIAPRERFINGEPAESFIQGVHNIAPMERLRINVQQNFSNGPIGSLMKANSSILHFRSRLLWSIFPVLLSILSFTLEMQSASKFGYLFLVLCFLGNLDIFAGVVASIVFISFATFNAEEFSFSNTLGLIFISSLFFLPSLVVRTLSPDSGSHSRKLNSKMIAFVFLVVHFVVLVQRSLLSESYLSTSEELLVFVAITLSIFLCDVLEIRSEHANDLKLPLEEVKLEIVIAPSRSALIVTASLAFSLIYAWSMKVGLSLLVAILVLLPLAISKIYVDRLVGILRNPIPRKTLIELLIVSFFTYLVFVALSKLPLVTYSVLETLVVAGFAPLLVYSIYVTFSAHSGPKVENIQK